MAQTTPFDQHPDRYDAWFDRHEAAYQSELAAIQALWPEGTRARERAGAHEGAGSADTDTLEIGVGTARFAAPLGITHGIDPSPAMRERARARGITVKDGVAEDLPYPDERFSAALLTTTLCYLENPLQAFREVYRVLQPGGALVVAFIDQGGPLGRRYETKRDASLFYQNVRFYAADEVAHLMERVGFTRLEARQTLFSDPATMESPDPVRPGIGEGGFVVIRGLKGPLSSQRSASS